MLSIIRLYMPNVNLKTDVVDYFVKKFKQEAYNAMRTANRTVPYLVHVYTTYGAFQSESAQ
jgi:hypothetical protein